MRRGWVDAVSVAIAGETLLGGLFQAFAAEKALSLLAVPATPQVVFLFAMLGALTALFGGALLHATLVRRGRPIALFWCCVQKACGSSMLGVATLRGLVTRMAWFAVTFDALGFGLLAACWLRVRGEAIDPVAKD